MRPPILAPFLEFAFEPATKTCVNGVETPILFVQGFKSSGLKLTRVLDLGFRAAQRVELTPLKSAFNALRAEGLQRRKGRVVQVSGLGRGFTRL